VETRNETNLSLEIEERGALKETLKQNEVVT
jgi:hypothetical protein